MKEFTWYSNQGSRFLSLIERSNIKLSDQQFNITLKDYIEYEKEHGRMTLDTFKERLEIRLSN